MTIPQRIARLEAKACPRLPGTIINRAMHPVSGTWWSVGIGPMERPKLWFHGETIGAALKLAEKAIL